jgi:hypothetical protein
MDRRFAGRSTSCQRRAIFFSSLQGCTRHAFPSPASDQYHHPFDSWWVPPVGGAPSRHTGTGGATAGVHAQCLRDSGAGDGSPVVSRAAARQSQVVPRSKQLDSQTRRCRAEQAVGQVARRGDAKAAEEMRGPPGGRAQEGRRQPQDEVNGFLPHWKKSAYGLSRGMRLYFKSTRVNGPVFATWIGLVLKERTRSNDDQTTRVGR